MVLIFFFRWLRNGLEKGIQSVEALREVLYKDAAIALNCVHWIYREAFDERMPFYYSHQQGGQRLDDAVEEMVRTWLVWKARWPDLTSAESAGELNTAAAKDVKLAHKGRAPRKLTENARRVQAFRAQMSEGRESPVRKTDISHAGGYSDRTMLRWFEAEEPCLTDTARENFNRVLSYSAAQFWHCVDEYQKRHRQ
jgi:hypothetical protein